MKCQISVSAPNRKHPEPVVRGEAVAKLQFRRQAGTDRGPFQSRPKVPIQKLSPSRSSKMVIHAPAFLAFAMQMLLNTRYCAKRAKLLFSAFEQTEGCLYAANSLEATPRN